MEEDFIYLANGAQIPFPAGLNPQQRGRVYEALKQRFPDAVLDPPTTLGAVGQALENIPRGAVSAVASMGQGALGLIPGEFGEEGLDRFQDWLASGIDPRYQESTIANIGMGLGSLAPYVAAGVATGGTSLLAPAALGGLSGVGQQAERMRQFEEETGEDISGFREAVAKGGGLLIGLTEALPIGGLGRAGRAAFTANRNRAAQIATQGWLESALRSGVEEGMQEATAGMLQNSLARAVYDPESPIGFSAEEFKVGFGAGAIFNAMLRGGGALGSMRRSRPQGLNPEEQAKEEARRQGAINGMPGAVRSVMEDMRRLQAGETPAGLLAAGAPAAVGTPAIAGLLPERSGVGVPNWIYPVTLDVEPDADGTYRVVDENGQTVDTQPTEELALGARQRIAQTNARKSVIASAYTLLEKQGLHGDPAMVEAAARMILPENTSVSIPVLASYLVGNGQMDPRAQAAIRAAAQGQTDEEVAAAAARRSELTEAVDEARERLEGVSAPVKKTRAAPVQPGRIRLIRAGEAEIVTDRSVYSLRRNEDGQWVLWMSGAISPYGEYRTRAEARDAVQEHERGINKEEAKAARAKQDRAQGRKIGTAERALAEVEAEVAEFEAAQPTAAQQEQLNALAQRRANGETLISMEEAREILTDGEFEALLRHRAGIHATTLSLLNEGAVAPENSKSGLPRVRKKAEADALIEQARARFAAEQGLADPKQTKKLAVTDSNITDLLRDKGYSDGIDSTALQAMAKKVTGFDVPVSKLGQDAKNLLYTHIAALPVNAGRNLVGLPDTSPPQYTEAQYTEAQEVIAGLPTGVSAARRNRIVMERTGASAAAAQQIIDHLTRRGFIRQTGKKGKSWEWVGDQAIVEEAAQDPAEDAVKETRKILDPDGEVDPVTEAMAEDIVDAARQRSENTRQAAEAQGQTVNEETLAEAEQEVRETAAETVARGQKFIDELNRRLKSRFAKTFGLSEAVQQAVNVRAVQDVQQELRRLGMRIATDAEPEAVYIEASRGGPGEIIMSIGAIDPEGTMTPDQIVNAMTPDLYYEGARWLRDNDMFEMWEWNALTSMAGSLTRADGTTYVDEARAQVAAEVGEQNVGRPQAREEIQERAVALLFRDHALGRVQERLRGPTQKKALDRVRQFFRSIVDAGKESQYTEAVAALNGLGEIGQRDLGMTPFAPEGEIRTDLYGAREVAAEPTPFVPAVERPSRGLSSEEIDALQQKTDEVNGEAIRQSRPPIIGKDASPVAQSVYFGPRVSESGAISPSVRTRLRSDREPPDPWGGRYDTGIDYDLDSRTVFERTMDSLTSYDFYSKATGTKAKSWWDKWRGGFRRRIADAYAPLRELDERYKEKQLQRDVAGEELLADQELGASADFLTNMLHLITEAMSTGRIRMANPEGLRYENGEITGVERTQSIGRHVWIVEDAPLTETRDGKILRSLNDVKELLFRDDGNWEKAADAYLTARRTIALHEQADAARKELQRNRNLTDAQKRELRRIANRKLRDRTEAESLVEETENREELSHLVDFAEGWRAWNTHLLENLYDAGVISEQTLNEWKTLDYVSFRKLDPDASFDIVAQMSPKATRTSAGLTASIEEKLMSGAEEQNIPLLERMVTTTESMVYDAMKNTLLARTAQRLIDLDMARPSEPGEGGKNTIRYYEGGQEQRITVVDEFNGPHVIAALNHGTADLLHGAWKALPKAANVLRQAVTRMPDFIFTNAMRDTVSVYATSGAGITPVVDTVKGFVDPARLAVAKQLGLSLAVDNINDADRYRRHMRRRVKKGEWANPLATLWDKAGDWSARSDIATRMAVFDAVYKDTGSVAEAQSQALNIINFGRRGSDPIFRLLTAAIPFLNARVQGLDILYRSGMGKYTAKRLDENGNMRAAGQITNAMLLRGAQLAALTAAYYALVGDEEWYKNQRDEVKDDNWILPGPRGTTLEVPIPFEVGVLFKAIPEQIMRRAWDDAYGDDDMQRGLLRAVRETAGISFTPQIIKPVVDAWRNRNSYTGEDIVPAYMMEGLMRPDRRNISTPETASFVANMLSALPGVEIDPLRVEYLVNGYAARLGSYLLAATDVLARREPVRDIFNALPMVEDLREPAAASVVGTRADILTTDPRSIARNAPFVSRVVGLQRGGGYQQDFYEMREEVDKVVAALNRAKEENRVADYQSILNENAAMVNVRKAILKLDKYMAEWRDRRDMLLRHGTDYYTADEVRQLLDELEAERDEQLAIVPFIKAYVNESGGIP